MKTKTLVTCLSVSLTMLFAASCGEDETPAPGESSLSKLEAAELGGKSDSGADLCEANGWYGDGECDTFCPKADSDCDAAYEPCGASSCGDTCSLCAPSDKNCIETAVVKFCHADGTCNATEPTCATEPYDSCGGKVCGDSCTACDPADTDCFETAVVKFCQADGSCGPTEAVCEVEEPYDSCGGKVCGDSCTACDPADTDCIETAVLKFCQADGSCGPTEAVCEVEEPYNPCGGGKVCGDTCTICDPADTDCFETAVVKYCQADGSCNPTVATCDIEQPYEPCGGKQCGDACTLCAPGDTDCVETAVLKFCSDEGMCNAGDAVCSI